MSNSRQDMKKQPSLLRGFFFYSAAGLINAAIPFLLLPLLTRYLSPQEYGLVAIYQALVSFLIPFIGLSANQSIARSFFMKSKTDFALFMGNACFLFLLSTFFFTVLCCLAFLFTDSFFGLSLFWLCSIPLAAVTTMIYRSNLIILRSEARAGCFSLYEVLFMTLNMTLSVVLVVSFKWGWEGRVWALVLTPALFGAIAFLHMRKAEFLTFRIDRKYIKEVIDISLPLIWHALGINIIFFSDRLFLDHLLGKEAVGLYTVGYYFGMTIYILAVALANAWDPWLYKKLSAPQKHHKRTTILLTYAAFLGILAAAGTVSFLSPWLIDRMTPEPYHSSKLFVPWIAFGYAAFAMFSMLSPYLVQEKKTRFIGISTFLASIINLCGNYILIQTQGAVGAAQATLISLCFLLACTWCFSQRFYPMPWLSFFKKTSE